MQTRKTFIDEKFLVSFIDTFQKANSYDQVATALGITKLQVQQIAGRLRKLKVPIKQMAYRSLWSNLNLDVLKNAAKN